LDDVLNAVSGDKAVSNGMARAAYPSSISVNYQGSTGEAIPYTFEDALVLTNIDIFKAMTDKTGLIKKMADAVNAATLDDACQAMFEALANGKKAEMALELLFTTEPNVLQPPQYIAEGLEWLKTKLAANSAELVDTAVTEGAEQ
jgi:hypothetical protein